MRYFQCRCGAVAGANSGEPVPACLYCDQCGTTCATNPNDHKTTPEPHDVHGLWRIRKGQPHYMRVCARFGCGYVEAVPFAEWPALTEPTP